MVKTDSDLVSEAQKGIEASFSELVRRHMEKAVGLAHVTVGNYEDAKDISQEAFVKAYRALGRFELKSSFSTWFYRILMNTAKDFLRRKRWTRFMNWKTQEEMEGFFEKVAAEGENPAENLLRGELETQINEAVKELPIKQKWVFTLRFVEGLSLREIAQATGLSEGGAKANLHFAVQRFKKEMTASVEKGGGERGL